MSKELKEKYVALKIQQEGEKWGKYYKTETDDVFQLGEFLFPLDKPRIKKSFCFGYGMYLQSTDEEHERANDMAVKAETDMNYFMSENLEEINSKINNVKYFLTDNYEEHEKMIREDKVPYGIFNYTPCITHNYSNSPYQVGLSFIKSEDVEHYNYIVRKATKQDLEIILAEYEKQKQRFIKRLNTYLKKYGLSKVHSWTYLVD